MRTEIKVLECPDADAVMVQFPYNGDTIAAFRNLPEEMLNRAKGYGWDRSRKVWVFPLESFSVAEKIIEDTHSKGSLYWTFIEHEGEFE